MPSSCSWRRLQLLPLLGIFATAGLPSVTPSQASPPPTPAVAAKMRSLLPFPEATLGPKMEPATMGLDYSLDQGFSIFRASTDRAVQIVAVQRQMTGNARDAARHRAMGELYHQAGLPSKSYRAFQHSAALYQAVLAQRPNDGTMLAGYGETLQASGQDAAAEVLLIKATQAAPESADVWLALGLVLEDEATPQTEAKSQREHDAGLAYDKAVSLAPHNPACWAARGAYRTWGRPQSQGKFISPAGLSDYERAAALLPNNPYAQAMVAWIDCMAFGIAHHMFTGAKASKMEPPASDHRSEAILRRITKIAQSTRGAQSASAYTARAWVQFEFFWDKKGAQKSLRLALQQNPRQQDAVDYQMHVAGVTGDYVLLAAACRRELHRRPQVYLRVLLADADSYLAQQKPRYWQEARMQMELAHAAAPHDAALRLGVAVLLLKSGQPADQSRAAVLLGEIAPSPTKGPQAEYELTRGISAALLGQTEEARRFLDAALQGDPRSQPARSALALI